MNKALFLVVAGLVGIASAQTTASSGGNGGNAAVESAMQATCQAMETFWSGLSPTCSAGIRSLMRQPNTPIGTIKSQVSGYVSVNCSSSADALQKLETSINDTIQQATTAVQSSNMPDEAKKLVSQMMSIPQNPANSPLQICVAEITALKGADPNVSEAIIRHMMSHGRHHGGPGGPGGHSGEHGPDAAGSSPGGAPGSSPAPVGAGAPAAGSGAPNGGPPSGGPHGVGGGSGGMSGGVSNWLKTVDPSSFCQEKMNKMASASGSGGEGASGGSPHFPMCGGGAGGHEGHDFHRSLTGGSNVLDAAKQQ